MQHLTSVPEHLGEHGLNELQARALMVTSALLLLVPFRKCLFAETGTSKRAASSRHRHHLAVVSYRCAELAQTGCDRDERRVEVRAPFGGARQIRALQQRSD